MAAQASGTAVDGSGGTAGGMRETGRRDLRRIRTPSVEGVHRARGMACVCEARLGPCFCAHTLPALCVAPPPYCPTPPAPAHVPALPRVRVDGVHEALLRV